jgi:hypothetical protein
MGKKIATLGVLIAGATVAAPTVAAADDHCEPRYGSFCHPADSERLHTDAREPEQAIRSPPTTEQTPGAYYLDAETGHYGY